MKHQKIMNAEEDVQIFLNCGDTPCVARGLGGTFMDIARRFQLRTENSNRSSRFYMFMLYVR